MLAVVQVACRVGLLCLAAPWPNDLCDFKYVDKNLALNEGKLLVELVEEMEQLWLPRVKPGSGLQDSQARLLHTAIKLGAKVESEDTAVQNPGPHGEL